MTLYVVHELLRVLLTPGGILKTMFFLKRINLTSLFKHVSPLAVGAFGCYKVLKENAAQEVNVSKKTGICTQTNLVQT